MAILTFQVGEGHLTAFDEEGGKLTYELLFGKGGGTIQTDEAWERIRRIRSVEREEASGLTEFLLRAGVLSKFRSRMSPEDWDKLLDTLPA